MNVRTKHIPQHMLYLNGVTVSFDGFKALNDLSFMVAPGELRAIIGPNGAGKTTMMDVITGKVKPNTGEVYFRDTIDLTQHDEADIANLGIGRKFQKPTVMESLSIFENLELALAGNRGVFKSLFHKLTAEQLDRINEILQLVGLAERQHELAGALSHGQKQWLEIGMLLIQDPELLLLDEPVAGMSPREREQTAVLLNQISHGKSLIVIEHDMEFVKQIARKVTVMHQGALLCAGSIEQVQRNERVIEVYLGA